MGFQKTIKNKVSLTGVGLHTGKECTVTLRPAASGNGIVFHRVDMAPPVSIEACTDNVVNTRLSTTIGKGNAVVATIEHIMAALRGCDIDNIHVDINGSEIPILDGSAQPFIDEINKVGVTILNKPRKYLVVKKPVCLIEGDKKITIIPSRYFRISFDMVFNHTSINHQFRSMRFSTESFSRDIASARTFGFLSEVELLKANGLARGGSLDNAVVIGENGILNPEGLRYEDEFVRHKILDVIGDMNLAGYHIIGHVKATKSGHDLNYKIIKELLSRTDCWKIVEFSNPDENRSAFPLTFPELVWSEA